MITIKMIASILLACFLSIMVYSQEANRHETVYDKLFYNVETPPIFPGNLSHYIDSALSGKKLPNKGRVILEVVVDSIGAPHYKYLYDHTDGDVSNLSLKQVINNMPTCTPAYQNGHIVNFLFIILLDFADRKLIRIRDQNYEEEMKYMLNSNVPPSP